MPHSSTINKRSQDLNRRPSLDNHLAQHSSRILLAGALLLVGACAALGSYFGFVIGSQQHVLLGLVFAGAALGGEIVKPYAVSEVVHALSHFNIVRALACLALAAVCVVYSFTAELSLAATTRGDLAASREAAVDAIRDARSDRARAETELASLQPARPAAELQAEIDGLLLTPGAKGCTKIDGRVQETICPKVVTLRAEKARSERRAQLEAAIVNTERPSSQLPIVRDADPLAGALAVYAGAFDWKLDAGKLLPWLALIPVAFLELGSSLAVVVVRGAEPRALQRTSWDTQTPANTGDVASQPVSQPSAAVSQQPSAALSRGTAAKRPKAKRKDREPPSNGTGGARGLAAMLEPLRDGKVVELSQRKIARMAGMGKSSVNRILHELAAQGALMMQTTTAGTRLALAG